MSDGRRVPPSCATLGWTGLCFRFLFPQPSFRCELNFLPFSRSPSSAFLSPVFAPSFPLSYFDERSATPRGRHSFNWFSSVLCRVSGHHDADDDKWPEQPLGSPCAEFRVPPGKRGGLLRKAPISEKNRQREFSSCFFRKFDEMSFFSAEHSTAYSLGMDPFNIQLQQYFSPLMIQLYSKVLNWQNQHLRYVMQSLTTSE